MRAPVDLHPDDAAVRHALRDQFIAARQAVGYSQYDLARRSGVVQSAIARREASSSWRLRTLFEWAADLRLTLLLTPTGLPPAPPDVEALAAIADTAPVGRLHEFSRAVLAAELAAARNTLGVSYEDLADVLGCTVSGVRQMETSPYDALLGTVQRHCRALGGALWVGLEPVTRPVEQEVAA